MNKTNLKNSIYVSLSLPSTMDQLNKLYFAGSLVNTCINELIKEKKINYYFEQSLNSSNIKKCYYSYKIQ